MTQEPRSGADSVASGASALIARLTETPTAWERIRPLVDLIGARIAGSPQEKRAVAWAKRELESDGLTVRLEPVTEKVWIRGRESATMIAPARHPIAMLGLGGSIGTPPEGITAPVVVVANFDELHALGAAKVRGTMVLFDFRFPPDLDPFAGYGTAVKGRSDGAWEAAKLGAIGALVRTVGTASLRTPHTGGVQYKKGTRKIPAAAIAIEDAELIRRLIDAGHEVRVRLVMGARTPGTVRGYNVIAEIRGRERPDEIVLIGAHLDSWDVGAGAIDDGSGVAMVLETMRALTTFSAPRRTVRAILFANEEAGLVGAKAYRVAHKAELARHVAALEADSGGSRPLGLAVTTGPGGDDRLKRDLGPLLAPLKAGRIQAGGSSDISEFEAEGVPLLGLDVDPTHYFDYHHSMADTLDKLDPGELQACAAVFAATTWFLAESDTTLPRIPPKPKDTKP